MPKGLLIKFENEEERINTIMQEMKRLCDLYSSKSSLEEIRFDEDTFHMPHADVCIVGTRYKEDIFYTIGYKITDQIVGGTFGSYDLNKIISILEYRYARYKFITNKDIDWNTYLITESKQIDDRINRHVYHVISTDDLKPIDICTDKWEKRVPKYDNN